MSEDPKKIKKPGEEPGDPNNPAVNPGTVDLSKLSDEQLAKVLEDPRLWKTERLSKLLEESKDLKTRKDAEAEAEKKRLEEQGEFKKLLEATKLELETAQKEKADIAKTAKIQAIAFSKGIKDVDAAIKLIDSSKIVVNDDGTFTGIEEAVESLTKDRPYLLTGQAPVGNPSNPSNPAPTGKFTISQIQDPAFYNEHRDEIMKAQREGGITEDRNLTGVAPVAS